MAGMNAVPGWSDPVRGWGAVDQYPVDIYTIPGPVIYRETVLSGGGHGQILGAGSFL
jgi:hypothetical protein